jgi:hypothetical protein
VFLIEAHAIVCEVRLLSSCKKNCTLAQALRLFTGPTAHRGSRGIALPFLDNGTKRGWGVSVTPRPLFTPEKTRYPLYRRMGGPQSRSGEVRKILPPPGFDPRTVQPVASRYTVWATRPLCLRVWCLLICLQKFKHEGNLSSRPWGTLHITWFDFQVFTLCCQYKSWKNTWI